MKEIIKPQEFFKDKYIKLPQDITEEEFNKIKRTFEEFNFNTEGLRFKFVNFKDWNTVFCSNHNCENFLYIIIDNSLRYKKGEQIRVINYPYNGNGNVICCEEISIKEFLEK